MLISHNSWMLSIYADPQLQFIWRESIEASVSSFRRNFWVWVTGFSESNPQRPWNSLVSMVFCSYSNQGNTHSGVFLGHLVLLVVLLPQSCNSCIESNSTAIKETAMLFHAVTIISRYIKVRNNVVCLLFGQRSRRLHRTFLSISKLSMKDFLKFLNH